MPRWLRTPARSSQSLNQRGRVYHRSINARLQTAAARVDRRMRLNVSFRSASASLDGDYRELLTGIGDGLVGLRLGIDAASVAPSHENDAEGSALQHAGELAFAIADHERLMGLVPVQGNGRVGAFLVVVGVVFVFVECEIAVRALVNSKFDGIGRFFGGPFFVRTQRENRARTDVERQTLQRSVGLDGSIAGDERSRSRSRTTSTAADRESGL